MPAELCDDRFRLQVLPVIEDDVLRATGNRYERAVLLAADGHRVWMKDGTANMVDVIPGEVVPFVGAVDLVTHNHPRGTSLTPEDVNLALLLGAREVNAFSHHIRYRLFRTGPAWPDPRRLAAVVAAVEATLTRDMTAHLAAGRLTDEQAEMLYDRVVWTRVAEQLGGGLRYLHERR
jgi:hypothetical protein